MTDFQELFAKSKLLTYPLNEIVPVSAPVPQEAFFPGGRGTIDNSEIIKEKSVMCLGQDWGTHEGYISDLKKGKGNIEKNPTWRNLRSLLKAAGIDEKSCFFTNSIMGLRQTGSASGKSPAFKNPDFIKECQDFFLEQISAQKPNIILVLGLHAVNFLSDISDDLRAWKYVDSFRTLDSQNIQIMNRTKFRNGITSSLAVLVHPSYRTLNVKNRSYKGLVGNDAELGMIKDLEYVN